MCACIDLMNERMTDHNTALVTTMFGAPVRVCVETYQVKTGRGTKKALKALASFCPFCGEKYIEASEQQPRAPLSVGEGSREDH